MIFEALQSELFKFHSLESKIIKIPEFNLVISFLLSPKIIVIENHLKTLFFRRHFEQLGPREKIHFLWHFQTSDHQFIHSLKFLLVEFIFRKSTITRLKFDHFEYQYYAVRTYEWSKQTNRQFWRQWPFVILCNHLKTNDRLRSVAK